MTTAACFLLLLLIGSVSSDPTETEAAQQQRSDVHAALRELAASLAEHKVQMRFLWKQNQEQAAKLEQQKTEVERQTVEINWLKYQRQVEQVAFSTSLLAHGVATSGPFPNHTKLIFRNVFTNIGNGYNPNTGVFTAPVRGVYHFEWHIGAHDGKTAAVLVKNMNHICAAHETQTTGYGSASQGASLLLEVGDTVFLGQWKETKIQDNQYHVSTFSGHLLFSM